MFTTNNRVLVDNLRDLPALMCFQRKAAKTVPTEEILIQANIDSFGDDIGKVTNRVTSMYDVQSLYDPDSEEYQTLEYRIMCGQQLQQNAIDKAKGIVAKPMPATWYRRSVAMNDTDIPEDKIDMYLRILADRKPYFMTYIYPDLKKEYTTFMKNVETKCIQLFRKDLNSLLTADPGDLSEDELAFTGEYYKRVPVSINNCVTNRICRRIEAEFDGYISKHKPEKKFNPSNFKSDVEYLDWQYYRIREIYNEYIAGAKAFRLREKKERVDKSEARQMHELLIERFVEKCLREVTNRWQLCNIIIDLCYGNESTKQFAWDVVGNEMLVNLLRNNNNIISYPAHDDDGDILWKGERYLFKSKVVSDEEIDYEYYS